MYIHTQISTTDKKLTINTKHRFNLENHTKAFWKSSCL